MLLLVELVFLLTALFLTLLELLVHLEEEVGALGIGLTHLVIVVLGLILLILRLILFVLISLILSFQVCLVHLFFVFLLFLSIFLL